jgi:ATP-dependent DNA helicase RecQ
LIESGSDGGAADPAVVRHRWNLFLELMRWAESGSCRHDAILRYFGDEEETLAGCGRCDNCVAMRAGGADNPEEVSLVVRKALSAVARVHGRFGLQAAAKLLRGADDPRLAAAGLQTTKTFGALSDRSDEWLTRLLRRCVTAGWVDFHGGDRPVVVLTEEGAEVMHARRPARLLLPLVQSPTDASAGRRAMRDGAARSAASPTINELDELDEQGRALFESLRRHRLEISRREGVPPFMVASDRTLRDMSAIRPRNVEELLLVHGIGPAKAEKYGSGLLAVVASAAS